jgi:protease-4
VKFHTVYAPESKDKNLAFEKALKGDYALMQSEILSPLAQQFQNHVKQSRSGKLDEKVPGILSGKMFFAQAALEHGLIDSIGNMQKAISKALELAEIKKFMNSQTTH